MFEVPTVYRHHWKTYWLVLLVIFCRWLSTLPTTHLLSQMFRVHHCTPQRARDLYWWRIPKHIASSVRPGVMIPRRRREHSSNGRRRGSGRRHLSSSDVTILIVLSTYNCQPWVTVHFQSLQAWNSLSVSVLIHPHWSRSVETWKQSYTDWASVTTVSTSYCHLISAHQHVHYVKCPCNVFAIVEPTGQLHLVVAQWRRKRYGGALPICWTFGSWFSGKSLNCCHQMSDLKAKMHQNRFRLGLRPTSSWGTLQRPRDP